MTANGERARVLQLDRRGQRLEQIDVIDEANAPVEDASAVRTSARGTPVPEQLEETEDAVCIDSSPALANLVRSIDARLERARREGRYDRLASSRRTTSCRTSSTTSVPRYAVPSCLRWIPI
jgi:hypothetical protein